MSANTFLWAVEDTLCRGKIYAVLKTLQMTKLGKDKVEFQGGVKNVELWNNP